MVECSLKLKQFRLLEEFGMHPYRMHSPSSLNSYLSKQSHLVGPLLVEKRGTGSLSTGSQSRWPMLRVPRAIGNIGRRNVQSGHGELIGVIPTPFASHAPLGRVALKRCRPGTFGDPRLLRRSNRLKP